MKIKKGQEFLCIKDMYYGVDGKKIFTEGKVYKSDEDGYITDDDGYWYCDNMSYNLLALHFMTNGAVDEDKVNNPNHYTQGSIEAIDAIESALGKSGFEGFLAGNCIKYMFRYNHKNGLEDLKKAQWYLNKLIDRQ